MQFPVIISITALQHEALSHLLAKGFDGFNAMVSKLVRASGHRIPEEGHRITLNKRTLMVSTDKHTVPVRILAHIDGDGERATYTKEVQHPIGKLAAVYFSPFVVSFGRDSQPTTHEFQVLEYNDEMRTLEVAISLPAAAARVLKREIVAAGKYTDANR